MTLRRLVVAATASLTFALVACSTPKAAPSSPDSASANPVASSGTESGANSKTKDQLHSEFITECKSSQYTSEVYCECGWGVVSKMFTLDELRANRATREQRKKLQTEIKSTCVEQLPEDKLKTLFVSKCSARDESLKPYCDCSWVELRKSLTLTDFADRELPQTDRFHQISRAAAKTCSPSMPEALAKKGFMDGCAPSPKLTSFCECAWKALRKDYSVAELNGEFIDPDELRAKVSQAACQPPK